MAPSVNCPTCRAALQLTKHDTFDSWICPNGHGLAATLSELYERAQEDEIHTLWAAARAADAAGSPLGGRPCPMCEQPMVSVSVGSDADEVDQGQPGDGADVAELPVDVCVDDQVIWFDVAELETLPADLPDAKPTPEQEAALADITRQFGEGLDAAAEAEARTGFTSRLRARLHLSPKTVAVVNPTNTRADA